MGLIMKVGQLTILLIFVASLGLFSCMSSHKGYNTNYFASGSATGYVNDDSWDLEYAFVDARIPAQRHDDVVFVFLPYTPDEECPDIDDIPADIPIVMASAPLKRTTVLMSYGEPRSAVFQFEQSDKPYALVAKRGRMQISSIARHRSEVKGKIAASRNKRNYFNGEFKTISLQIRYILS